MITRYSAWMDGVGLQNLDPTIYIIDIEESVPAMNVVTMQRAGSDGLHVARRSRQSLTVTIRYMVREYDTVRRKDVYNKIAAWARGKYLSISDRPGQRLRVQCDATPVTNSALKWTEVQSLVLTAYQKPYWEDETPITLTATGRIGEMLINTPANAVGFYVDVAVKNVSSATINTLRISTHHGEMFFEELDLAAGDSFGVWYDDDGILRLPIGKRTAQSVDEFELYAGEEERIVYSADNSIEIEVFVRGRYE